MMAPVGGIRGPRCAATPAAASPTSTIDVSTPARLITRTLRSGFYPSALCSAMRGSLLYTSGDDMRRQIAHLLVAALIVSAGLVGAVTLTAQGASTIARGAEIAPVPLNMKGLNPALVREGSYIVNAQGACNDCHTAPSYAAGGNPFFGQPEQINAPCYLAGGVPFGPPGA